MMEIGKKIKTQMFIWELIMSQLRVVATFYQTKKHGWVSEERYKKLLEERKNINEQN